MGPKLIKLCHHFSASMEARQITFNPASGAFLKDSKSTDPSHNFRPSSLHLNQEPRMPSNLGKNGLLFLVLGNFIRNLRLQTGKKGPLGGLGTDSNHRKK